MTKSEMLASARQALEFNQGSMVIPLKHVEKFLEAQEIEMVEINGGLRKNIAKLEKLTMCLP